MGHYISKFGRWVPALLLLSLGVAPSLAQIDVSMQMENIKYIQGERIPVNVAIINHSGETLVFSDAYHNAELKFNVTRDGSPSRIGQSARVKQNFVVMSEESVSKVVDIGSLLKLNDLGSFQVRFSVTFAGRVYYCQPKSFDIVPGIVLVSRRRLLKDYPETVLTYSVRYVGREGREHAFLMIKDEAKDCIYGSFFLGRIVRVTNPVLRFDEDGRAVVVHQSGLYRYSRSVFSVDRDGARFISQKHYDLNGHEIRPRVVDLPSSGKARSVKNKKK